MKRITRDLRKLVVSLAMLLMLLALGLFAGCSSEHTRSPGAPKPSPTYWLPSASTIFLAVIRIRLP